MSIEIPFERFLNGAIRVQEVDAIIASQNERLSLLSDLDDEELRSAAATGLYEEQQITLAERGAAAETIDYDMVAQSMHADDVLIKELSERRAETEVAVKALRRQAEISLKVSPTSEKVINRIFDQKQAVITTESEAIREQLESILAREAGYIAIGAAWTVPRVPIQPIESQLEAQVVDTPQAETINAPEPTPEQVEGETNDNEMVLVSVMWSVCEYAMARPSEGVRIEEMRRVIPELAQLSDSEYKFFKSQFAELRELIQARLTETGVAVEWRVSGKTRGTRYHLETRRTMKDLSIASDDPNESRPNTESDPISDALVAHYGRGTMTANVHDTIANNMRSGMITTDMPLEQLAEIPFIKSILHHMDTYQTQQQAEATRRTVLVRELSNALGIDATDLGFILSQLVSTGLLHERDKRGMKMLSTIEATCTDSEIGMTDKSALNLETAKDSEVTVDDAPEEEPELQRTLKLLRWGRNDMNRGKWLANDISLHEVTKKFRIKDVQLCTEIKQWVEWLCANPTSTAANKVVGAKVPTINIDGQQLSVWRLAPNKSQELLTRPESKYMRVMYAFTEKELFIIDILDHDQYDSKYLNRK